MANEFVQTMADASIDAQSLSEFVFKPAGFKVTRRLAPTVDTLQFYIDRLNSLNGDFSSSVSAALSSLNSSVAEADGKVAYIETTVQDAINNTAIEGGVLADTFVTMTKKTGLGTVARTLRDVNSENYSVKDFGALGDGSAAQVSQWFTVGSAHYRGYANLEAVQLEYPHVVNGSDTIDFAAIQAAINSKLPITIPKGVYSISRTLKTQRNTVLKGQGRDSVLEALGVTGAVILTYSGAGEPTAPNQVIGNFSIVGTATCAIAFAHFAHSKAELIYLSTDLKSFIGVDGFVFEYFWATKISQLFTNGATLSGTPFVCNKGVLDTIFDLLYTSNLSDYMLLIDSSKTQYSTGTGWGTGRVSFNLFTAQGARKYAMYLKDASNVHFYSLYTENNIGALRIDSAAGITFNSCDMSGTKIVSEHDVWIDSSNSINSNASISSIGFNNCLFLQTPKKIIGRVSSGITFNHCSTVGLQPLFPLIQRTENTPSTMPLYINEQRKENNVMYLKTNDFAWRFAKMEVTSASGNGVWASNPVEIPPLTALTVY